MTNTIRRSLIEERINELGEIKNASPSDDAELERQILCLLTLDAEENTFDWTAPWLVAAKACSAI